MLLVVGQIFLVGGVVHSRRNPALPNDFLVSEAMVEYAMSPTSVVETPSTILLREVIESEIKGDSFEVAGKSDAVTEEPEVDDRVVEKPSEAESPAIINLVHETKAPFQFVHIDFSTKVRVFRQNHHGKLLRIRFSPAIAPLTDAQTRLFKTWFSKFALHQTSRYSEMTFYGEGELSRPIVEALPKGVLRVSIPLKKDKKAFPIRGGTKVASGIWSYNDRIKVGSGYTNTYILRVDPFAEGVRVFPVLANEEICQKESLSSMAKRYNAVAGINGAYFTPRGDPIGTLIINRRLLSSPLYNRSVFGISRANHPIFGNPDFSGMLFAGDQKIRIDAVNQPRGESQLVVFTPEYARTTLTTRKGVELVIVKNRVVGINSHDSIIPPDGVVISAGGMQAVQLSKIRLGETVSFRYNIHAPWDEVMHAVCGGPRLLKNGKVDINCTEEKFSASIVTDRHPRTAVGVTFDGEILFIVVDGRHATSIGMTLRELAEYFKSLGGCHAINLDGGGSSSMYINGRIVNRPSDGRERPISNGILITSK